MDRSDNPGRTHRLRPPLASKKVGDKVLPQWQYEISAAGRIHYCPDQDDRIVWVTLVSMRHPKATE